MPVAFKPTSHPFERVAEPGVILASFAGVIALGFLGYLLFERTRITDVLILIALGFVLGPLGGVFNVSAFTAASALIGTLALIIIMFDGGLGIQFKDLVAGVGRAAILAIAGFAITVVAVASVAHYVAHLDWISAFLLGSILGGSSGIIIMPIIARTSAHNTTRVVLTVESAFTDVLCVVAAVTLIGLVAGSNAIGTDEVGGAARGLVAQFSIAIVFGLIAGIAWLRALRWLSNKKYSYMITLAAVLALYAAADTVGGNGAIGVLIFGVVLGNGHLIPARLRLGTITEQQRQFQGEIAFLVRAFFFVYLGVILDPTIFHRPAFLITGGLVFAATLVARVLAVHLSMRGDAETKDDRVLMSLMGPRGLAAAVLAGLPAEAGIAGTQDFVGYAFAVIVGTNVVSTLAVFAYEMSKKRTVRLTPDEHVAAARSPEARR